jgi:hypothetical protein
MPEADELDHDAYCKFVSARVVIPVGGVMKHGVVVKRKRDEDGLLIGVANKNPILDTSLHEVEFDDGLVEAFTANTIAENIWAHTDNNSNFYSLVDEILDHEKTSEAVHGDDQYVMYKGKQRQQRTTKGWKFCVRWKDTSISWVDLKDLKESNPVEVAEHALANKLVSEPDFKWWVLYVLKKREQIISKIKTQYLRRKQKFGILLPKTVEEVIRFDEETGTTFWQDAIRKEMGTNIMPAVKILELGQQAPVGSQQIPCHTVFNVKIDFTRKARFVAGGHVTDPPTTQTYASVVSRDSVRIAFLIAALNDLDIMCADIQGAYLNAPCKERVHTVCGPEFGKELQGRSEIIVKALYGL